ncbi:MAG: ABC transporter permease, partial [Comamonas sp.]
MAQTSSSLVPARLRWWQLRRSESAVLRALGRSLTVQAAVAVLLLLCGAALFTPWLALQNPFDPAALELLDAFTAPGQAGLSGATYPLGADEQGRDVYSAILYGLRMSL